MPDSEPAARDYPGAASRSVVDPALGVLARLLELQGLTVSIGVVLVIPGGVLAGHLVNGARWYREWLDGVSRAGEAGAGFANALRNIFEADGRASESTGFIGHSGEYLHILDGVLHAGDGKLQAMPWRVQLDSVSAWSLGAPPS